MEMNICKYLRRPESVKYTHHCVYTLCEGFSLPYITLTPPLSVITLFFQQYWISARDLHDSLHLLGSKMFIMTKKCNKERLSNEMHKNEEPNEDWLQFTLNPKCMCAKCDWAEQLTWSNRWLFLFDCEVFVFFSHSTGRVSILTSVYCKSKSYCEHAWLVIQIYADFETLDLLITHRSQPSLRIALA